MSALPRYRPPRSDGRLTAGDVSRALHVDVKTVHNWVRRGYLQGTRTKGGHLRFVRAELVRFLRRRGRTVPAPLASSRPATILVGSEFESLEACGGRCYPKLFDALLDLGTCDCDVLAVSLALVDATQARELVLAVRRRPTCQSVAIVGVGGCAQSRAAFLSAGADAVLDGIAELPTAVQLLSGTALEVGAASAQQPRGQRRPPLQSSTFAKVEAESALSAAG
jgi:hypothetical protein